MNTNATTPSPDIRAARSGHRSTVRHPYRSTWISEVALPYLLRRWHQTDTGAGGGDQRLPRPLLLPSIQPRRENVGRPRNVPSPDWGAPYRPWSGGHQPLRLSWTNLSFTPTYPCA